MDRLSGLKIPETAVTAPMHSQQSKEDVQYKTIGGKLKKILDIMPTRDLDGSSATAEKVAEDFRDQINLQSEHSVNGMLANGVSESTILPEQISSMEERNLFTGCSSRCDCLSGELSECKIDGNTKNSIDSISILYDSNTIASKDKNEDHSNEIVYVSYESELQMPDIMRLIQKDLSEPYSIYTYRYFIHNWPKLCFLAMIGTECVGAIVCKLDLHRKVAKRGYIAMLAVDENHRNKGIGSNLVLKAIGAMVADNADEVVLETEITNQPALRLYENLGFVRDKRLFRYYLNGVDALRLKLWLR